MFDMCRTIDKNKILKFIKNVDSIRMVCYNIPTKKEVMFCEKIKKDDSKYSYFFTGYPRAFGLAKLLVLLSLFLLEDTMKIGIIMGSKSDLDKMTKAAAVLDDFHIDYEMIISSAHRTPEEVKSFVTRLESEGAVAFIAGAGAAAHLPGVVASFTTLPVIGIPLNATGMQGLDSLLAIVQMPSGMPVATMAIDGAKNAALFAVQICGAFDQNIRKQYQAFRKEQADKVNADNAALQASLHK